MKSIKDFKKVEIATETTIYGGGIKTGFPGDWDKWKKNGDLKTNVDWNPFNNDRYKGH